MQERRHHQRARVILGGVIAFNQRRSTLECVVKNLSDAGAKIVLDNPALLPDRVDFVVNRKGCAYIAEIIWRNEQEAGLSFRASGEDNAPVPLDWARRLRACEADRRSLQTRIAQLSSGL